MTRSRTAKAVRLAALVTPLLAGCHHHPPTPAAEGAPSHLLPDLESQDTDTTVAQPPDLTHSGTPISPSTTATTGTATPGAPDVCSLISASQASSINHVSYGPTTTHHIDDGWDICVYKDDESSTDPVNIQPLTTQVLTQAGCYALLKGAEGGGPPVPGVGDDAFGYPIGLVVEFGNSECVGVSGLTDAELHHTYGPDAVMANLISTGLH